MKLIRIFIREPHLIVRNQQRLPTENAQGEEEKKTEVQLPKKKLSLELKYLKLNVYYMFDK